MYLAREYAKGVTMKLRSTLFSAGLAAAALGLIPVILVLAFVPEASRPLFMIAALPLGLGAGGGMGLLRSRGLRRSFKDVGALAQGLADGRREAGASLELLARDDEAGDAARALASLGRSLERSSLTLKRASAAAEQRAAILGKTLRSLAASTETQAELAAEVFDLSLGGPAERTARHLYGLLAHNRETRNFLLAAAKGLEEEAQRLVAAEASLASPVPASKGKAGPQDPTLRRENATAMTSSENVAGTQLAAKNDHLGKDSRRAVEEVLAAIEAGFRAL